MSDKHSPIPWSKEKRENIVDRNGTIVSVAGIAFPCGYVDPQGKESANAEFIVRCVNNFDALLDACRNLLRDEKLDDDDPRLQRSRLQAKAAIEAAEMEQP